ncbi:T6SS effector phospholipase Tle3 domain-containing protein [Klebsiella variicola]|uniref:T6SS effector phospholipase Tle3 domain-containing protein n=1 Tax=Klebsiella variicola TaxID=244366 RepID=UPI00339C763B
MNSDSEPIRELECKFDDNWHPSWYSFPSHKNCQIRGDCDLPPHLPGIIILVHGVNSTGEWFSIAENKLCEGLNKRLGLNGTDYKLEANKYLSDDKINSEPLVFRDLPEVDKKSLQLFVLLGVFLT